MDEEMKLEDYFPAFTELFKKIRPQHQNMIVYEVDAGKPTDRSMSFKAASFEEGTTVMLGLPVEVIISKEWILEYFSVDTEAKTA